MGLNLNGNSLAPGLASRLDALSRQLEAEGHPAIVVASGRRSTSLQEEIFRDRYVRQTFGTGPYNDVRWWDGDGDGARERWVRVKAGGTVLPPGDSTHEDPPATGVDLAYPYNNRYTAGHARLLQLCEAYGIRWTGQGFGEDWHFDDIWNPYTSFASSGSNQFEGDDLSQADVDQINEHTTALFKNFLGVAGQGYTVPQLIQADTADIRSRIAPPGQPWDQLQLIVSLQQQMLSAIASENGADFTALFATMTAELKADYQTMLQQQLAEVRTALAGVDGVTEADLDAALATLTISRAS